MLFDFGGVILSSPFEAFNRYEAEVGLPLDTIRSINATNPDDNAWAHFERGEYGASAFIGAFEDEARTLGFEVDGKRVIASLRGVIRPTMVEALRRCSAEFKTAMLTNNFKPPSDESGTEAMVAEPAVDGEGASLVEIHELFDEIIESSVVGVRKPEPRFTRSPVNGSASTKRVCLSRRPRHQPQTGPGHGYADDQGCRPRRCPY